MINKHVSVSATHLGELLREIILPDIPMSKVAIAEALQISRQTLYDILTRNSPSRLRWLFALASSSAMELAFG